MVDFLSDGRVDLGLASGWFPNDFVLAPPGTYERRSELVFDRVEDLRKLWSGDTFDATNPLGDRVQLRTMPRPVQRTLPIWITAAGNPQTFRRAGTMGLNILTHLLGQSLEALSGKIADYRQAWREAGHGGRGTVTLMLHTFVGEDDDGKRTEPYETVVIDVDDEYSGTVVEKMAVRKGEMTDMRPSGGGKTRITFSAPSRGLIGYHGEFLSDTRGTGIMNRLFEKYGPHRGPIEGRKNGVLISNGSGEAVAYALGPLEERGILMVSPGEALYEGMIIGENAKPDDLEVNPMKSKQLTNFRSTGKDDAIRLTPPWRMTLEQAIAYVDDDEMVEVTPKNIRLRKRFLDPNERKKQSRSKQAA